MWAQEEQTFHSVLSISWEFYSQALQGATPAHAAGAQTNSEKKQRATPPEKYKLLICIFHQVFPDVH